MSSSSNKCQWLTVGKTTKCNKKCVNNDNYCRNHRMRIKYSGTEPYPCRKCGKGTKSETRLCYNKCGGKRVKRKYKKIEKTTRSRSTQILDQLKEINNVENERDYNIPVLKWLKNKRSLSFKLSQSTMNGYLRVWDMAVPDDQIDLLQLFILTRPKIKQKLIEELRDLTNIKAQIVVRLELQKEKSDGIMEFAAPYLSSNQIPILNESEIEEKLDETIPKLQENLEKWTNKGSGWVVNQIKILQLKIAYYQPFRGGSYIILPEVIRNKKAVINVKNKDDNCLRWALRSAVHPVDVHSDRPSSYPKEDNLDFSGIDAPTPISQIKKVEQQNNLAINVYGWDSAAKHINIYQISNQPGNIKRINLLLIEKPYKPDKPYIYHYTWIKNFNRLLTNQSKHHGKKFFCERCLHCYSREDLLEAHKPDCMSIGKTAVRIKMPEEGKNKLSFKNWQKQMPVPYIIYADFESLTTKIEGPESNPSESNTQKTEIHEVCGFCYIVVRYDGLTKPPVVYRGHDAAKKFLIELEKEEKEINTTLESPEKIKMTQEDWVDYKYTTHCHVCTEPLGDKKWSEKNKKYYVDKVRDHCHITGKYRGAAHFKCNLNLQLIAGKTKIPVVFHNLKGYDSHLIIQDISKMGRKIDCIANNMEQYITFSLGDQLRFIDSFQFLSTSLNRLVTSNTPETFHITTEYEPDPQKQRLLLRKGVYPYEYMSTWERFEDVSLPPQEAFYSKLTDSNITEEEYKHAQEVWKTFKCQTMGDYHDLYLKTDVLLLADVFEKFRKTCLKQYCLDPAHYYTSPGLSWDALLKKTGVELELLTDYDMHLFIEKGLRGGISMVSKRYAKANNPHVTGYNPDKPNTYILYLDANNLYGWAMSQPLPIGGFEWVTDPQKLQEEYIVWIKEDTKTGYIYEVDLEYPHELHDTHNSYPLAPESMKIKKEWLSEYQQQLLGKSVIPEKLVPNLCNKKKYVVHYRNLQLYLSLGMKLTKVHRALKFNQDAWMKPYIELNTNLRKNTTSDFEKDLYKLMNNSVFGKTMENLRKRKNIHLVCNSEEDKLRRLIARPNFLGFKIFDNMDLSAIDMYKEQIYLCRPVYVGISILDLSKYLMYDFFYNNLKKQYGECCNLLYTDTDSLLLEIQTDDVYADMKSHADFYDTSDYPVNHPLHSTINKKVPGKMKDETPAIPIAEYVGLRPKMYSILKENSEQIRKAKGVKKYVVKKHLRHDQYKESLFNSKTFRHGMNTLRSEGHQIYGLHVNKISLCPLDTKRWIEAKDVNTLAFGHKRLK